MLEKITWGQYWWTIVMLSAIYYFLLLVLLYQKGMLLKRRKSRPIISQPNVPGITQPTLFENNEIPLERTFNDDDVEIRVSNDSLMPKVYDFVQEIKSFLNDIGTRSSVKEEIIMGLQIISRNYKDLEKSPYQKSINDFILSKCEENCSIHLSAEDLKSIWLG